MGRKEGCEDGGAPKAAPLARATQQVGVSTPLMHGPPPGGQTPRQEMRRELLLWEEARPRGAREADLGCGEHKGGSAPRGQVGKRGCCWSSRHLLGGRCCWGGAGGEHPGPCVRWGGAGSAPGALWGERGLGGAGTAPAGSGFAAFQGSRPRAGLSSLFVVRCSACWRGAGQIHFIKPIGRSRYGREPVRSQVPYSPRLMPANSR